MTGRRAASIFCKGNKKNLKSNYIASYGSPTHHAVLLLKENEENCKDQAYEGGDMVPMKGLALEHEHDYHGKHRKGYHFLDNLQLKQVERPAIGLKANAVCRYCETILKESNAPGEQYYQNKGPTGRYLHFTEFEMAIPRECHEDVRKYQHQNRPETLHNTNIFGRKVTPSS